MSADAFHLRDKDGNVTAIVFLACYDAGQVNLSLHAYDGRDIDLLCDTHMSAAAARRLAAALLDYADVSEGGTQ